ncbi:MAG: hypothetical protein JSU66_16415 [Deltaproteobacteria bacterium]|nr:MAG: hypothetical protein JSU66_16415 [Deltaproteobacteria bacterium]
MGRCARAAGLALALALAATPATANEYDPERAGHPLRIIAYVFHPLGFLIDRVLMRPAHWIGSREPAKTVFGHKQR